MDLEKLITVIVDDLQKNAMPFETYAYEVKATHQIIRKHLTAQLNIADINKQRERLIEFADYFNDVLNPDGDWIILDDIDSFLKGNLERI